MFCELLALEDNHELQPLYSNPKKSESLPSSSHKINVKKVLLHDNIRLDTSVCIIEVITNYAQTLLPYSLYRPDLAPSDYHLLAAAEKVGKLLPSMSTCSCSKIKEELTKTENTLKITMPSAMG